jgi:hypothetical protein
MSKEQTVLHAIYYAINAITSIKKDDRMEECGYMALRL